MMANSIPIERCERIIVNGSPVVAINGEPTFFACHYLRNYIHSLKERWPAGVADSVRQFAAQDIHRFEVVVNAGWTDQGFDPSAAEGGGYPADLLLRTIAEADPQAQLIIRLGTTPPPGWLSAHEDERERDSQGKLYEVSFASDAGFAAIAQSLGQIISYLENSPYAGHIAGYNLGLQFEGVPLGSMFEGAFTDYSPVMQQAFAAYIQGKYGDEAALREAWGDPVVSLDAISVPTPEEHLGADWRFIFHHPVQGRKVRDYYDFMDELTIRRHRQLARAMKEACGWKKLVGVMGGYNQDAGEPRSIASPTGFPEVQLHKQHFSGPGPWGCVFETPEIDFFFAPTDYLNTGMGGVVLILNMPASQRLHGKLSFMEDDQRTHLHREANWNPMLATAQESVAASRRNSALLYTEADICNWMEQVNNWLLDPAILEHLGSANQFLQVSVSTPNTVPEAICVLFDEESQGWTKPTTHLDEELFYLQRNGGLSYCGVPVRHHLLSDLAHDDFPAYKCYLLPNLYHLTEEKEAWINAKLKRNGNLLVWLYGAGYVGKSDFSVETMARLTGIRLGVYPHPWEHRIGITNWDHPITRNLPGDLVFGTSRHYGPIFHVEDANAVILGRSFGFAMTRRPALAIKEFAGEYASVYCEAPNLPAVLLRELARYAGCHIYLETNDFLIAGKDIVAVHSAKPGPRRLALPSLSRVTDAYTGQLVAERTAEITFDLGYPETVVFRVEPSK
ncbi:MAG: hypothetical protein ACYDBB_25065 [Armatimonadota bacterium]